MGADYVVRPLLTYFLRDFFNSLPSFLVMIGVLGFSFLKSAFAAFSAALFLASLMILSSSVIFSSFKFIKELIYSYYGI